MLARGPLRWPVGPFQLYVSHPMAKTSSYATDLQFNFSEYFY